MSHDNGTLRILRLLILFAGCVTFCFASQPQVPHPIESLDLSELLPSIQGEPNWLTVTFLSETSIGVGICQADRAAKCSLSVVRWENGTLRRVAQTSEFNPGAYIREAGDGKILMLQSSGPTILFSADLSTRYELSEQISLVSASGKTVAETTPDSWKIYRLTDKLEPLRHGTGYLQSISDRLAVIRSGNVTRVETLEGKELGSLSLPSHGSESISAGLLGDSKLYLDDCKMVRVVNFDGISQSNMRPNKGCSGDDTRSSTDGRRMLFDFSSHKVNGRQHLIESIRTMTTLGMAGAEDVNAEDVRVFDTVSGKACFYWYRRFPPTNGRLRSAAISPSGEFVAIAADKTLSVYLVRAGNQTSAISPEK
jgi:hypothetical protein